MDDIDLNFIEKVTFLVIPSVCLYSIFRFSESILLKTTVSVLSIPVMSLAFL